MVQCSVPKCSSHLHGRIEETMTITTLTSEQRAAIPAHVQHWIDVGLSTAPMDRDRAAQAVLRCYELAGLPSPSIEFAQSFRTQPPEAWLRIQEAVRNAVRYAVWDAVWDAVGDAVWDAVWDAVLDAVWDAVWDAVCSGQYDADACAFWRFCVDVLGIEFSTDVRARIDAWCAIVESCGGVYWGRDVATIVDRPEAFERDPDGRITAVVYRDGWKVQV